MTIVGVHTPETGEEHGLDALRRKLTENGLGFPVVVDNDSKTWNAWANNMWPSVYLIDKRGNVRTWWYGELNWQGAEGEARMRRNIEQLLAEDAPDR